MDLDDALALTSADGERLLAQLPPYDEKEAVALTARLRRAGHDPRLVAAALTQSRLRAKAESKFGAAAQQMLFTPDALEQATRAAVAARHAQRFLDVGITHVIDGGCGIGADAVGFAHAGLSVTAIEADPATASLARHNLAAHPNTRVETGLLEDVAGRLEHGVGSPRIVGGPEQADSAWWFDPARRVSGVADIHGRTKRTFSLAALSPEWDLIQRLAATTRAAGAKLSPGLAHGEIPAGTEAEFTSYAGDVVEATVWWGDAARNTGPSASILKPSTDGSVASLHITQADAAGADGTLCTRADVGPYLYEADKALTRSGLVGAMQNAVNGRELTAGYGYVTSDVLVPVGLLGRRYRVLDLLPLHTKTLRSHLRAQGVGRVTIKKRDVHLDADQLRRELKLKGSASATLLLSNLDGARTVFVVEEV